MIKTNMNSSLFKKCLWIIIYLIIDEIILRGLNIHGLNWFGKLTSIIWSLVFIYYCPLINYRDCGLTLKQAPNSWPMIVFVACLLMMVSLIEYYISPAQPIPANSGELIVFELTLPGIDEELCFRGILIAYFLKVVGSQHIHSIIFLSSLLFVLGHVPQTELIGLIDCFILSMALAYLFYQTKSLLFPIIWHNLANVFSLILALTLR